MLPWWRHLVSDCKVKSRTLAPSVWQPTPSALNLVVPVLRDRCSSVYIYHCYLGCVLIVIKILKNIFTGCQFQRG